jgi:hypothetical protein
MDDKDKEYLRDLFAMFKSITQSSAEQCYKFADEMIEAREHKEPKMGITAVEPKRRSK